MMLWGTKGQACPCLRIGGTFLEEKSKLPNYQKWVHHIGSLKSATMSIHTTETGKSYRSTRCGMLPGVSVTSLVVTPLSGTLFTRYIQNSFCGSFTSVRYEEMSVWSGRLSDPPGPYARDCSVNITSSPLPARSCVSSLWAVGGWQGTPSSIFLPRYPEWHWAAWAWPLWVTFTWGPSGASHGLAMDLRGAEQYNHPGAFKNQLCLSPTADQLNQNLRMISLTCPMMLPSKYIKSVHFSPFPYHILDCSVPQTNLPNPHSSPL